jgi:hypothetical protein
MNNHFDYESANLIGEVKYGLRAVPLIRSAILQLGDALSKDVNQQAFLLLVDSSVSRERINEEWMLIQRTISPDIARRISIYLKRGDKVHGWPGDPDEETSTHLLKAMKDESSEIGIRLPKTDYFSVILKILLLDWLGPSSQKPEIMTMKRLGELAGCSYPTVASSLDRLKNYLKQSYSEGVQLRRFPNEEWHSMILGANKIRATLRLADRSGQPRRPSYLLERLARMQLDHVGVGGVLGAMAVYPDLNITGSPRLDICIHAPGKVADIEFVKNLDPALEPTTDLMEPAQVFLHFVRSDYSDFEQHLPGLKKASWVECMLDLHEMRLGEQADEWLHQWIRERELGHG